MIGRRGEGQVAITGAVSRRQVHRMRAESDAILIGIGTALADDPELTCRLPGLEARSPARIVLDAALRLPVASKLAAGARQTPVLLASSVEADEERRAALSALGVGFLSVDLHEGRIALPELLEDLAAQGFMTLMVEGGAETARQFLAEGLVDRIALFAGPEAIGEGVAAPVTPATVPAGLRLARQTRFGDDVYHEYVREG
jgi:diaminohydroxyphosphoribosylaminopyrimidine deaminase/5-amino-6-(5-phosphoribosylamino)uracil reductase